MSTVLLQQMESMLTMWETMGGSAHQSNDDRIAAELCRLDMCRSALSLFASGSGAYRALLQKLFGYTFGLIDMLAAENRSLKEAGSSLENQSSSQNMVKGAANIRQHLVSDAPPEAHDLVRAQENKMTIIVRDAAAQRVALQEQIKKLEDEKTNLELLLGHQMMKNQRGNVVEGDVKKLIKRAENERAIEEMEEKMAANNKEMADMKASLQSIKELNAKYAAQSMELATRIKILLDHNQKVSAALSLQEHDLLVAEKESEEAKNELADAKRINKLLSEALEKRTDPEQRETIVPLGVNPTVPKHLQSTSLTRKFAMSKEMAQHLVFDLVCARRGKTGNYQSFVSAFLTRRHGAESVSYAHALDFACQMFDADVSLQTYHAVSRCRVSEELYAIINSDAKTFVDICAVADMRQHRGTPKLSIPFVHVAGILIYMFPGYDSKVLDDLIDSLDSSLSNTGALYYGTLFPDLDRDDLVGVKATAELSTETTFSRKFKECILTDTLMTLQRIEDHLLVTGGDSITLEELFEKVKNMSDLSPRVAPVVRAALEPIFESGNNALPMPVAVASLRTSAVIRNGVSFGASSGTGAQPHQSVMARVMKMWNDLTNFEALEQVDYDEIVARNKRVEFSNNRRVEGAA